MSSIETAFGKLLSDRELYLSLDKAKRATFRTWKKRFADGTLNIDKQIKILEGFGYTAEVSVRKQKPVKINN